MSKGQNASWRINVAAIIMDADGCILLGQKSDGSRYLHFPQGGVKCGETPRQAILREIREEVGLPEDVCIPVAEFPGLRYVYRKKNKKSRRWVGQQQTYFLLRVNGKRPETNCSNSEEFSSAHWIPFIKLSLESFVPFKREAVARALRHFFPAGNVEAYALTARELYQYRPGSMPSPSMTVQTPLFAGGKVEAQTHMESLPPLHPRLNARCLLILIGMEGCGLRKAVRCIARYTVDPIALHLCTSEERYNLCPHAAYPSVGELSVLTSGIHTQMLKKVYEHAAEISLTEIDQLEQREQALQREGVTLLKVALYVGEQKQAKRLAAKGKVPFSVSWDTQLQKLCDFMTRTSHVAPWHLLPCNHGWYRDYLLISLIRDWIETTKIV